MKLICPKCRAEGTFMQTIVKDFMHCRECQYVEVPKRKTKTLLTKKFSLGNKTLYQARDLLDKFIKQVPEGAITKIEHSREYISPGRYTLTVTQEETDKELFKRMELAIAQKRSMLEKKEKERKEKAERRKKLEEKRERERLLRLKKAEQKKKEKEKLEKFFLDNGISIDTVKRVLLDEIRG